MKKSHIFGIVIIAVAIAVILTTASDASTYTDFGEARSMYDRGNDGEVHVVGKLKKDSDGRVVGVLPSSDKLSVQFTMIDNENNEQVVFYNNPMPSDLLRSEQVVVVGKYRENVFHAENILLKCPSKYNSPNLSEI